MNDSKTVGLSGVNEEDRIPQWLVEQGSRYTAAQWDRIDAAFIAETGRALQSNERVFLEIIVREYSYERERLRRVRPRSPKQRSAAWNDLSKRALTLKRRFQRLLIEGELHSAFNVFKATKDRVVGVLADLQWMAMFAHNERVELASQPNKNPAIEFYTNILEGWRMCGGKLGATYDPATELVQGNFVEYFLAVTQPIMDEKAPSRSSIPAILRRYLKSYPERNSHFRRKSKRQVTRWNV